MVKEKFILYLIYGMVYILLGFFACSEREKDIKHIPLVKSLKYLGIFGLSHGLSEWFAMISMTGLYNGQYNYLYLINQFLKAVSFAFLMYFGIDLMPKKNSLNNITYKAPILMFMIWFIHVAITISKNGISYFIDNQNVSVFLLRYGMAVTGSVISATALYMSTNFMREFSSPEIERRYKRLAIILLIYGLVDGILVSEKHFFHSKIINYSFFHKYSFNIKLINILIGIRLIYLLSKVMQTFGWEQQEKLKQLRQQKVIDEERRKLGLEIHDGIIQNLYASGLQLEYVLKNFHLELQTKELLEEIKIDLGKTIKKTREFISKSSLEEIELEDLKEQIENLVKGFNENQDIKFKIESRTELYPTNQLSVQRSTHVYYIVQEAINNIVKHSKAKHAKILLDSKFEHLYINVIDNGIGISNDCLNKNDKYGIKSMKERAKQINGLLNIKKLRQGTEVELIVPYEQ